MPWLKQNGVVKQGASWFYGQYHRVRGWAVATQVQYEYFKYLHDAEQVRYRDLINRGNLFLSIITIYSGLLGLKLDKMQELLMGVHSLLLYIYFVGLGSIIASLGFVVYAIGIHRHERPTDPTKFIENLKKQPPTDDEFFDDRIIDLTVATNRNFVVNERRASALRVSSFILFLGIFCQAAVFALALCNLAFFSK